MKKKNLSIVAAAMLFLFALLLTLYPLLNNYLNDRHQSEVRTAYTAQVEQTDKKAVLAARRAAMTYNTLLQPVRYTEEALQVAMPDYDRLLNLNGDGTMGYAEIPKIGVCLPIYHGTDAATLDKGLGHLLGSSLPVGGKNAHTVLTGHSGVAGKRLLSDLEQLQIGDVFYLYVLDEMMTYRVSEIHTVLPHETALLESVDGDDLCTLVTCTPYGVNTHRLLVRGRRITCEEAAEIKETTQETVPSAWEQRYCRSLLLGAAIMAGIAVTAAVILILAKRRRNRNG